MFCCRIKQVAQIDDAGAVQLQSPDGSATDWRQPDDECAISIPREMLVPLLAARMKEWSRLPGQRIGRFRLDVLMTVTTLTRRSQVIGRRFPVLLYRDDMFDGEG